jgi:hypothetical protein
LQHKRHGKRAALWIPSIPLRFIPEIQSNIFHQQFSSPVQLNLQSTKKFFRLPPGLFLCFSPAAYIILW